jgi:hypothetical protein
MKSLRLLFAFILMASLFSCDDPLDFDTLAATDFPPGILEIRPGGKQLVGDFDVSVKFVDGSVSPLQTATITLSEVGGGQLISKTESLSGTSGEVVIPGSEFGAADLPVGNTYRIDISVTDTKNQTTNVSSEFEISLLPFDANHNAMWVSGAFNGWAADEGVDRMTLVADNIWEIQEIDLQGQPWKIKNTFDWSDEDWGDGDCDRQMTSNQADGGNSDTDCGISGLINLRFNDNTLTYSWEPAVTFESNASGMYLLGEFNNFEGEDYAMTQTADYTWEIQEVELEQGVEFKFAESPDFMGKNWGDADGDGRAEEFGPNIVFGEQTAFYNITFNDRTLQYDIEFVRFPSIGIIGSATPGGWDTDTNLNDNGDGTFSLLITLTDGEAKFRANDDWAVNWGGSDWPSGVATQDGPNIPVTAGTYRVTFNPGTGEYSFEPGIESMGIIGDATPGGWDTDTDMRDMGDGNYQIVIGLSDGLVKFRANNDWPDNWGAEDFPSGVGTKDGPNIPVTKGIYKVDFNVATGAYNFEPVTIGVIGSATPGGWDSDTDMTETANVGELTLTTDLTDGEAKFRAFNDWPWNWGASDFPSGVGFQDGPNIPVTAGTYTITFNVNTGAYSFQ